MTDPDKNAADNDQVKTERIAKVMARSGICSRREAEKRILDGAIKVNGKQIDGPAFFIGPDDRVEMNGRLLALAFSSERPRLFLYHKPADLLTTNKDPQGRQTIFDRFPKEMPRVVTVGRLDMNTEGLLLLTTDGHLSRYLELPSNAMERTYRARAFGNIEEHKLEKLRKGITYQGVRYAPAIIEVQTDAAKNNWFKITIGEGKNREVRNLMEAAGLQVGRLIRVQYGPFYLGNLPKGAIRELPYGQLKKMLPDYFGNKEGS